MLDTGIQPFCNLIGNVVTTFYTSLLVSNLDPSVSYSDDTEGATRMTPFFFLDPSSQGTGMTGEGGYSDDTILFSGFQTGMTGRVGYSDDGGRSYLNDIVYYTMFVQFWIKKLANKFVNISIQLINAWFFTTLGKIL